MARKITPNNYTYAVGRRKSSVATVKLYQGKGETLINGLNPEKYFPDLLSQMDLKKPFVSTHNETNFYYLAKILGGGKNGQKDALVLALARSIKKIDPEKYTSLLRQSNLLTVDSRVRQRRNVGTGGKARRQKQSPKR